MEEIHHNLFTTLLLGSKAESVLVKRKWYIQMKMYRLYRKMTILAQLFEEKRVIVVTWVSSASSLYHKNFNIGHNLFISLQILFILIHNVP